MATSKNFGKRGVPTAKPRPASATAPSWPQAAPVPVQAAPAPDIELETWKRARAKAHRLPWRQISFIASLCFGIASLVLPDDANTNLRIVVFALMGASFLAGLRQRRENKKQA